jgi:hypothetical protein
MTERKFVCNPSLHDGHLFSLELRGRDLYMRCEDYEGADWTVIVKDVVHLKADDFWEGNIIFEFAKYVGPDCPEDLLRKVENFDNPYVSRDFAPRLAEIHASNMTLLELGSSYGCSLLALCKGGVEFVKGHR